jgi:hypothetical protein
MIWAFECICFDDQHYYSVSVAQNMKVPEHEHMCMFKTVRCDERGNSYESG